MKEPVITLGLRGIRDAIDRLEERQDSGDLPGAQVAVGEALFWIAAVDEVTGRATEGTLLGLRWARNRVGHQLGEPLWLQATAFVPAPYGVGAYGTVMYGGIRVVSGKPELRWRPRAELPQPTPEHDRRAERDAYDAHLAGNAVLRTLQHAAAELAGRD